VTKFSIRLGLVWFCVSLSSLISNPQTILAEGFRILDQGAAATGQGAAFSAQADDPSALHYNPAGMTQACY
jgi:long-chain fatty acid transport protein